MFYASIHIDLPSEELLRRKTAWEWIAGLIGREPQLGTGEGLSTVTGMGVLQPIVAALTEVGIIDVFSVTVDRRVAYVDTEENSGDLHTAVAELDARRVLEQPFELLQMVLSDHVDGVHTLVEVRLDRRVPVDAPELEVRFAGRIEAMRVARGESPSEFAERLRTLARGPAVAEAHERFASLVTSSAAALTAQLGELAESTTVDPVVIRLIRPGPRALDHFRRLTWGPSVRLPSYRPVPIRQRRGAYDELFYHHYFDPYFDFVSWVTLTELTAGRGWSGLDYEVVDEAGERVFGAADANGQAPHGGEYGQVAPVEILDDALVVDPAVPALGLPDIGEIADPRLVLGYGGDGMANDAGTGADWGEGEGGGSGGVSGGDVGGSCGASCGGCGEVG
jgi:hypothetical protein